MANKVTLGNNPENFVKPVEIILLSGTVAEMKIRFKYRTRKEFAKLLDDRADALEAMVKQQIEEAAAELKANPNAQPKRISTVEEYEKQDEVMVGHVLNIADDWDLSDAFSKEKLLQLEDENPGSLTRIAQAYAKAVAHVREKN